MELTGTLRKIELISPERAKEWLAGRKEGEFILLDVRQPQEYRSGHIPGSAHIPLPDLLDRAGELDASKPVVAYCRAGNRSRSAAAILLTEGFSSVYSMDGGITAWDGHIATGDYEQGLILLSGKESAEELISLAWSLEEGSRIFYEKAIGLISDDEVKDFFRLLAGAEEKHKANLLSAYRTVSGKDFEGGVPGEGSLQGIMEGGLRVEDVVDSLKSLGGPLRETVEISMQVEANALDLYIKMSREIQEGNAKKIFLSLIEEEKLHLSRLGSLLDGKFPF